MNKPRKSRKRKVDLAIELPNISFDLQCPVCEKYYYSAQACYKHLFENCLRTKNSKNAVRISNWFSVYLWSNCKSKLDSISNQFKFHNEGIVCNYCKKKFLDKGSLLSHFRSTHQREDATRDPICSFCNFKPGCSTSLFKHLIRKHVECGCKALKATNFSTLKEHLSMCTRSDGCLCPTCQEVKVKSYTTETEFETHILYCRRPVPLKFSSDDFYTQCDMCWHHILKCNLDAHLAKHMKFTNSTKREQTNKFISFSDLKDSLSEEEFSKMNQLPLVRNMNFRVPSE